MSKRRWPFTTARMIKYMHEHNAPVPGYNETDVNRFSDSIKYDIHIFHVANVRKAAS